MLTQSYLSSWEAKDSSYSKACCVGIIQHESMLERKCLNYWGDLSSPKTTTISSLGVQRLSISMQ